MAGDYDVLSVKERTNALKNIRDEIDACIKTNNSIQTHYSRVMNNRNIVDWLQMWDDLESKIAIARTHASAALAQLTELLTVDTIYPYFSLQYEWVGGSGGIRVIGFLDSANSIEFMTDSEVDIDVVPTSEVTAGDWIIVEGTTSNDGIHIIDSVTADSITATIGSTIVDEESSRARVRVIRRTV